MKTKMFSLLVLSAVSLPVFAGPPMEATKEEREKMAVTHEQVAACLRSDKSMEECHKIMMANHPKGEKGSCPMMEHHGKPGKK